MTNADLDRLDAACQPGVWGYDPQLAIQIQFLIGEVRGWRKWAADSKAEIQRVCLDAHAHGKPYIGPGMPWRP